MTGPKTKGTDTFIDDLRRPVMVSLIDMMRWLAALIVMLGHLRNPLFFGFGKLKPGQDPIWVKAWYFVTGLHGEAVIVFFVLSGFLVGGLSLARDAKGSFNTGDYAIDRFSRLYVAFLPALFLTVIADYFGSTYFSASGLWNGTNTQLILNTDHALQDNLTLPIFLGNALMLQNYYVDVLGSNMPLWTLSTEFWFYVMFGAALFAARAQGRMRWIVAAAAVIGTLALGSWFIGYFGLWFIGCAAAALRPSRIVPPWLIVGILAGYLVLHRLNSEYLDQHDVAKFLSHVGLSLLVAWLLSSMRVHTARFIEWLSPVNKFMADFSYSLYLIHFPLMLFAIGLLGRVTGVSGFHEGFSPTDPVGLAAYAGIALFLLFAAWLFSQLTERQTWRLRKVLKQRLHADVRADTD